MDVPGRIPVTVYQRFTFVVDGIEPAPQGSKRYLGFNHRTQKPIMRESSEKLPAFRNGLVTAIQGAVLEHDIETFDGPLVVFACSWLPVPAGPMDPLYPIGPPDGDKILRAICDALTIARVIADDARIVTHAHTKMWNTDPCNILPDRGIGSSVTVMRHTREGTLHYEAGMAHSTRGTFRSWEK